MLVHFQEVSLTGVKTVRCPGCQKRLRRQQKFCQTLNPFNRRPDGTPKDRDDIYPELEREIKAWKNAPETCARCEDKPTPQEGGDKP